MALDVHIAYEQKGAESVITIDASDVDTNDELGPFKVPERGRIRLVLVRLESGTGTTVDPYLWRRAAAEASNLDIAAGASSLAPAANINEATEVPYVAPDGQLWLQPNCDAGNDNVVHAELCVIAGWGS